MALKRRMRTQINKNANSGPHSLPSALKVKLDGGGTVTLLGYTLIGGLRGARPHCRSVSRESNHLNTQHSIYAFHITKQIKPWVPQPTGPCAAQMLSCSFLPCSAALNSSSGTIQSPSGGSFSQHWQQKNGVSEVDFRIIVERSLWRSYC